MYATLEEARNRLLSTVVVRDGQPVYVTDIAGRDGAVELVVRSWPFNGRATSATVRADDPSFNRFVTPPLGFANYFVNGHRHSLWCTRTPVRRMQQGLIDGNFTATAIGPQAMRFNLEQLRPTDAFVEMIRGEYPSFDVALAALVPDSSIAVTRSYALLMSAEGYTTLYEGRDPLGLVMRGAIYLRSDRLYAREAVLECDALPNDVQTL